MADAAGAAVWRWDQQEPFGLNAANEDPDGNSIAFDLPLRLPGQYYDAETGLHYNYYRDYDPSLGRYGESDPIGLRGGLNTYSYVGGDPLSKVDPEGLKGLFPEIPRTPEDVLKGSISAAKAYGAAKGVECAQQCAKLKNPRTTPGLAAAEICYELMPWTLGHLRGSQIHEACVDKCLGEYKKICDKAACTPGATTL